MKQSLKSILHNELRLKGQMTLQRGYELCDEYHFKYSNYERRMRESMEGEYPLVVPIKNPKGAIIGYRWNVPKTQESFIAPVQESIMPKFNVVD